MLWFYGRLHRWSYYDFLDLCTRLTPLCCCCCCCCCVLFVVILCHLVVILWLFCIFLCNFVHLHALLIILPTYAIVLDFCTCYCIFLFFCISFSFFGVTFMIFLHLFVVISSFFGCLGTFGFTLLLFRLFVVIQCNVMADLRLILVFCATLNLKWYLRLFCLLNLSVINNLPHPY